ncbi:hypothetical protein HBI17_116590 [Parastagonospora nodorum]|nr:hypothetical protein HBI17_116590 [Parastagonospora nodorum]
MLHLPTSLCILHHRSTLQPHPHSHPSPFTNSHHPYINLLLFVSTALYTHIHQHIHQHISKPSNIIMQLRPSVKSAFRKLTGAGRHRQPSYDSSFEDSDYDYPRDGHRLYDQRQQAPNYQEQQEMSYQRQQATNYSRQPTDYRHQQDMDYQRHQQAPNYKRQLQDQVRMFATSGPLDDEYDRDVSPCVVAGEKEQGKGMKMAGAWVD